MTEHDVFEIVPESEVRGKAVRAACVGWCEKRAGGERVQKTSRLLVSRLRSAKQQRLYLLAIFDTNIPEPIHVKPRDGLCPRKHVWRLRRAMNGTRLREADSFRVRPRRDQDRAHVVQE